jgi:hypothetical protein
VRDTASWLTAASPTYKGKDVVTTITTPADAKKLYILAGRKDEVVSRSFEDQLADFMVVEGEVSTATTYEPYYNGGTATAEMLLKVGDYQDVQSILDGVVTRNVGVKMFDGSEAFDTVNDILRYNLYGLPMNNKVICSHFDGNVNPSISTSNQPDLTIKGNLSNNNTVYFKYAAKTTIEDFQQWLADQYAAGTPVTIIYPLAQAVTEQVAPQVLNVQTGDNILEITQASIDDI